MKQLSIARSELDSQVHVIRGVVKHDTSARRDARGQACIAIRYQADAALGSCSRAAERDVEADHLRVSKVNRRQTRALQSATAVEHLQQLLLHRVRTPTTVKLHLLCHFGDDGCRS